MCPPLYPHDKPVTRVIVTTFKMRKLICRTLRSDQFQEHEAMDGRAWIQTQTIWAEARAVTVSHSNLITFREEDPEVRTHGVNGRGSDRPVRGLPSPVS